MSTFTDGFPPSVAPEPEDGPGRDLHPARGGGHSNGSHAGNDDAADSGPLWLREEIQRRIAEKSSATGGRHARRDGFAPGTPVTYVPRHSTTTPGPAVAPPSEPSRRRERRDEILAASATTEAPTPATAWSQPKGPGLPDVIGGPARPRRIPRIRTRDLRRPAPPTGPAAARLLSPPPSPPVPPQPTTPADGVTRPVQKFPKLVREEVLWSATSPPREAPNPAPVVPEQRITERDVEKTDRISPHPLRLDEPDAESAVRRVRVVLAERKNVAKPVRTVVDIQEGSAVGELLRQKLIGSQLGVSLRFAAGTALTLGILPLLFALFPQIGQVEVLGIRLPWLLLGFLVYPFLLGVGWWHTRTAERVEQSFADHVQD